MTDLKVTNPVVQGNTADASSAAKRLSSLDELLASKQTLLLALAEMSKAEEDTKTPSGKTAASDKNPGGSTGDDDDHDDDKKKLAEPSESSLSSSSSTDDSNFVDDDETAADLLMPMMPVVLVSSASDEETARPQPVPTVSASSKPGQLLTVPRVEANRYIGRQARPSSPNLSRDSSPARYPGIGNGSLNLTSLKDIKADDDEDDELVNTSGRIVNTAAGGITSKCTAAVSKRAAKYAAPNFAEMADRRSADDTGDESGKDSEDEDTESDDDDDPLSSASGAVSSSSSSASVSPSLQLGSDSASSPASVDVDDLALVVTE